MEPAEDEERQIQEEEETMVKQSIVEPEEGDQQEDAGNSIRKGEEAY